MHQLQLWGFPSPPVRGPDFVNGRELGRIQEGWRYRWSPSCGRLIECARYGASVEEAATTLLRQIMHEVEHGDGRSGRAAALVVEAACCGLHSQLSDIQAHRCWSAMTLPSIPAEACERSC